MTYSDNGAKPEIVHSFSDQICPCCRQSTRLHCMELPSFRLALCSLCGGVIRETMVEGLPKIKQMHVPYPSPMDSNEVRCHACSCQIRVEAETGRAICKEPTCGYSWRLPMKSLRERALEKERKEILKRIADTVVATMEYNPLDKQALEEVNILLQEARQ